MRIAIDGRWIFREMSGIGAYTRELIRNLAILDRRNEYVVLFNDRGVKERTWREAALGGAANFTARDVPYGVFSVSSQFRLPSWLRRARIDVFHSTNYMIPFGAFPRHAHGAVRCVTTIHDVIPLVLRDQVSRSRKARMFPVYRRLMLEVGARSDAVITDSRASRADILKCLRIPRESEDKVKVIYCGVAECFVPGSATRAEAGVDGAVRKLLYVGRSDPYKNLVGLIRALAIVRGRHALDARLTVVGSPDPRYPEAGQVAGELGLDAAVRWVGYLPDDAMVAAYQAADLLVHPSRYEGFGLQVAEAMACGVPVICSNAAALPEVAGEAAILVDPDDVAGLADRIAGVLTQPEVARAMAERGRDQARKFTWARTAAETLALYEQVVNT